MKFVIISGNPKTSGLCRSIIDEIIRGAKESDADIQEINTNDMTYCRVCGDGWGTCLKENKCSFGDDGFTVAQETLRQADAVAIVTPVYWAEVTESLKNFLDRFRRCEQSVFANQKGILAGKPVLLVASPGGSGRGSLTTLQQMERFCEHTGAIVFDYIMANRWNSDYKRDTAYYAAKALAGGRRKIGETVDAPKE
ncbi:flavodoxin family protein [Clostridia bacterium]|nr:flavodoxin family protein [Clostridia bacterium]